MFRMGRQDRRRTNRIRGLGRCPEDVEHFQTTPFEDSGRATLSPLVIRTSASGQPVPLYQDFSNLHGVRCCPFTEIVGHHPKIETVRYGWVAPDAPDKDL